LGGPNFVSAPGDVFVRGEIRFHKRAGGTGGLEPKEILGVVVEGPTAVSAAGSGGGKDGAGRAARY
jgi:hypothetical protein